MKAFPTSALMAGCAALTFAAGPLMAQEAGDREAAPADTLDAESAVVGTWKGVLDLPQPGAELTAVFHVERGEGGDLAATMDSPDQGAMGIPVTGVELLGDTLRLEVASIGGEYEGRLVAPDSLRGEWRQPAGAFPLHLHKVDGAEAPDEPDRPQEPEPPFPYGTEDVRFGDPTAAIELAGTLTLPQGEGPFPAAVLLSGSGPQDRDGTVFGHRPFLVLADHLTREGIAVLRYDDRGVGGSGGAFEGATVEDFAGDALAAVGYLAGRAEVDEDAVGLVGHSEGGLTGPLAETRSEMVDFLVLLAAPALPGDEILRLQAEAIMEANGASEAQIAANREVQDSLLAVVTEEPDPEERRERLRALLRRQAGVDGPGDAVTPGRRDDGVATETRDEAGDEAPEDGADDSAEQRIEAQARQMGSAWFRHFLLHDPRPVLAEVDAPVLALWGGRDLQVPPDENLPELREALEQGASPDVTARELSGLNHLFQHADTGSPTEYGRIEETFAPEAMDAVARWILERFGPSG